MTFGSLFAGIGGIDLGLERAGLTCAWQVECDPYCLRVLAKHWPEVPRYDDVRTVGADDLAGVDLIAGGFPCQDISYAGNGAGLAGERSGLWFEFARVVGELGPRYVLVENVEALRWRGLDLVLGTLAEMGFDAQWGSLSACALGAPHMRKRLFVVAYPQSGDGPQRVGAWSPKALPPGDGGARSSYWRMVPKPRVRGVADGVPRRVDRLRGLGNAVVPQVAELLGRALVALDAGGET